ncbi:hypothetical protein [Fulvivirga ligni]|uniref:hypothetical protein n=1 Tax=Fulvivirga ligni TaxID=2904246 RepID=UPI001F29A116|nr:hypothetical protein [Fulvivirga ligni]UII22901.1 hypothetical protein LVD16_06655 [Fulvivirga ligni]
MILFKTNQITVLLSRAGHYLSLLVALLFLGSCEVDEIPENDVTRPSFVFYISGPGVNVNLTDEMDYSDLVLKLARGGEYSFVFIASDAGAMAYMHIGVPVGGFDFFDLEPENIDFHDNLSYKYLALYGDRNDPRRSLIMTGDFISQETTSTESSIQLYMYDFGTNISRQNVKVRWVDQDPGIERRLKSE